MIYRLPFSTFSLENEFFSFFSKKIRMSTSTETKTPIFNCGKMLHIFKTEKGDKDGDDAMSYTPEWLSPEAEQVMAGLFSAETKVYRKIDGSCGAIIRGLDGSWTIYQRYDDKKGKIEEKELVTGEYIPLPEGENERRRYYLRRIDRKQQGKNLQKMADELYRILDRYGRSLSSDYYSVELVGKNFNATPNVEGLSFALHCDQEIHPEFPRMTTPEEWLIWLKDFFSHHRDEGLILVHRGKYWKIHGYKFNPNKKDYMAPNLLPTL